MTTERIEEFELYLSTVENVQSLEELKLQLDQNEKDYGERYYGSHALYFKIWSQLSLIDALENILEENKETIALLQARNKVLDKATLKQLEEINELNKIIKDLQPHKEIYEHIDNVHGYITAINSRIVGNVDSGFSSSPSRKYFANILTELESIKRLKNQE